MPLITEPGIYSNISNEDYHASPGISNSSMNLLLPPHCPKLFWYQKLSGMYQRKESDAFNLGTAVHTLAFEPDSFPDRFHCVQEIPKRGTILGKEAHAAMMKKAGTKQILDADEFSTVKWMAQNLTNHAMWKQLKGNRTGKIEDSIMWRDEESGALLRTRPDYYNDDLIVDIKTTKDASQWTFASSMAEYAYHRQASMACDGLRLMTGREYSEVILFVVEKNPPHFVRCYVIKDRALTQGRDEYKKAAMIYQNCLNTGTWESFPEIIEDIDLPEWAYRRATNE